MPHCVSFVAIVGHGFESRIDFHHRRGCECSSTGADAALFRSTQPCKSRCCSRIGNCKSKQEGRAGSYLPEGPREAGVSCIRNQQPSCSKLGASDVCISWFLQNVLPRCCPLVLNRGFISSRVGYWLLVGSWVCTPAVCAKPCALHSTVHHTTRHPGNLFVIIMKQCPLYCASYLPVHLGRIALLFQAFLSPAVPRRLVALPLFFYNLTSPPGALFRTLQSAVPSGVGVQNLPGPPGGPGTPFARRYSSSPGGRRAFRLPR